jgi:dihydroxy-acid dehydratase
VIDAEKNEINVMIDEDDLNERRKNWVKPTLKISNGVLTKYSKLVSDASNGCVTT